VYLEKQVEQLFKEKKLVLVLDLDNTLIHTRDMGTDRRIKQSSCKLVDPVLDLYYAEMHPWKYQVKCRPFLIEFLTSLMPHF
jgi:TFIIF-interacting CTD phosphatase-like protein